MNDTDRRGRRDRSESAFVRVVNAQVRRDRFVRRTGTALLWASIIGLAITTILALGLKPLA